MEWSEGSMNEGDRPDMTTASCRDDPSLCVDKEEQASPMQQVQVPLVLPDMALCSGAAYGGVHETALLPVPAHRR